MTTNPWKDYTLVETQGKQTEVPVWFTPKIDRKVMKGLMKRSDRPALINYGLWVSLIVVFGALTIATWGTFWGVVALVIYSTIHQSATARQHELSHGTPFRTRNLNEFFFHLSSFITLSEGHYYRWRHARHHTHTIIVGKDPEIQSPRPPELISLIINIFNIKTVWVTLIDFLKRAGGDLGSGAQFVPETEQRKVVHGARIYLGLVALIILASVVTGSWLPLLLTVGPRVIGAPLYAVLHFTQHAGLNEDVYDHRLNSRTIYMNPVLCFLYGNMNYHVEHHMFPMVPYYNLPALHELIKDQCPAPKNGLFDAYREIIPTLLRQLKDPAYHVEPKLPAAAA